MAPMHSAAGLNKRDVVKLLLASRADSSLRNNQNMQAVDLAQRRGHDEVARLLRGNTAASPRGAVTAWQVLLDHGWIEYHDSVQRQLAECERQGLRCCRFRHGDVEYLVDILDLSQTNCTTSTSREVRRKPTVETSSQYA